MVYDVILPWCSQLKINYEHRITMTMLCNINAHYDLFEGVLLNFNSLLIVSASFKFDRF